MRNLFLLFFFLTISFAKTMAASSPVPLTSKDSLTGVALTPAKLKLLSISTGQHMNRLQRLEWKWLQHKWHKKLKKDKDPQKTKDTVATIALISGIGGLVLLFVVPALGMFLMLAAVVTGIIGLSHNSNKKSRTKALIGLIAGGVGVVFVGAIIIALASILN